METPSSIVCECAMLSSGLAQASREFEKAGCFSDAAECADVPWQSRLPYWSGWVDPRHGFTQALHVIDVM